MGVKEGGHVLLGAFYFDPSLGKGSKLTHIFQRG